MSRKKEDALFVTESTTPDEIMRFVRQQIRNPVHIDRHTIWNFSSYEFDSDAFVSKRSDELLIPYEVPGTWGAMFGLLPERIRNAEILVYQDGRDEYIAYRNFYNETPELQREEFRSSMAKLIRQEVLTE